MRNCRAPLRFCSSFTMAERLNTESVSDLNLQFGLCLDKHVIYAAKIVLGSRVLVARLGTGISFLASKAAPSYTGYEQICLRPKRELAY